MHLSQLNAQFYRCTQQISPIHLMSRQIFASMFAEHWKCVLQISTRAQAVEILRAKNLLCLKTAQI